MSITSDLNLIDAYDTEIAALELHLTRTAKVDDPATFQFLRTVPGIGPILGLVMLYEIDAIRRFAAVGNFLSYARLVTCTHECWQGQGRRRARNRQRPPEVGLLGGGVLDAPLVPGGEVVDAAAGEEAGKKKAHAILEAKIGRTVYHLWCKQIAFDPRVPGVVKAKNPWREKSEQTAVPRSSWRGEGQRQIPLEGKE